jgi:REP element-mobilizing transposase RayT
MARPLRIEQAEGFHHVLNRGNERRAIFADDVDREAFLARLGRSAERFEIDVFAYVLMSNHYHLLLRTRRANLSPAMQWLGVSYSIGYNRRHDRCGHLFQGRFKSFIIQEDAYLYRLLLYIHRNPLRAGLVARLADYPWSSYRALAYERGGPRWFNGALVREHLGIEAREFRHAVSLYDDQQDGLLNELHYGLVLGSRMVVETLRRKMKEQVDREKPQLRQLQGAARIEDRIVACRRLLDMEEAEYHSLRQPARRAVRPRRDLLIYLLWRSGGLSLAAIGEHFQIGYPAVSMAKARAQAYLQANKRLQRQLGIII